GDAFGGDIKASAIAIFKSEVEAANFVDFYRTNKDHYSDIKQVSGLSNFLPVDQSKRIQKLQEISDDIEPGWIKKIKDDQIRGAVREIKATAYDLAPYTLEDLPPEIREPFIATDSSGDYIVYLFDIGGKTDGRKSMRFSD